ncbi:MAG: ABC transporter permease subunit [Opitutaceae bacterium]|nr:ABC transporter permease subunit [Verrucomicrobiales bacterium]
MWPVVFRELRVQARRTTTFWLRVVGVLAAVGVFCLLCFARDIPVTEVGGTLFMSLHAVMMIFIWLAVPLMVSDSIARERREGTFGLLFLTPLRPIDVLLGKLLVHFLEAMILWVSVLPVMVIPFLLGGVTSVDVVSAMILQGTSIVLALLAGLLASVCVRDLKWATALAVIIAAALLALLVSSVTEGLKRSGVRSGRGQIQFGISSPSRLIPAGYYTPTGADGLFWLGVTNWKDTWALQLPAFPKPASSTMTLLTALPNPSPSWMDGLRNVIIEAAGVALLVFFLCAVRVHQLSRDRGVTKRELWLYAKFCRPTIWKALFRRRMRGSLDRNPIGWLHIRSITGRLTLWIWVGVVAVLETYSVVLGQYAGSSLQLFIGLLLMAGMAFSSANSFREERQSGALELILVTPIREGTLLWGRLRGIWLQFLPAVSLFVIAEVFYPWNRWERSLGLWEVAVSFFCLPVVGMFFSLQRFNALTATLATMVCWLGVPLAGQVSFWLVRPMGILITRFFAQSSSYLGDGSILVLLLIGGAYLAIALAGLGLYFFVWATRPGMRIFALIMVLVGASPFLLMLSQSWRLGLLPISLAIAPMLVLEFGRRLHQGLRTRRFLNST